MIANGLSKDFPAAADAEGICRLRSRISDIGGGVGRRSRSLRRRRLELRRMNSFSREKSAADGSGGSRKRRSENKSAGDGRIGGSGYGVASLVGRRKQMEDALAAELGCLRRGGRSYDFYGVYDGHGGRRVAEACAEMMHGMVAGEGGGGEAWEGAMAAAFRRMDEEVNARWGRAVSATGSTAVVAVVGEEEVVVANCGDSRAVLCRGGAAVQLSEDHKPDRADEVERIEGCGGMVINWNGARVIGVLATSRSIGDYYLKPYVIPDPEVQVISRTSSDEFLILASDGLWDVVTNELACQVTKRCLAGRVMRGSLFSRPGNDGRDNHDDKDMPEGKTVKNRFEESADNHDDKDRSEVKKVENRFEEAAAVLAELAIAKGSGDNVSVVVVGLR
ncbi:Protein phosphatase 2C 3 [Striga hermonthica]|uniref:protein-serine/threonine phosphatase n=1 Tax=Striga hermonthica TaxID=68872 RepID=A0A9N7MTZ6_STRHE|nr:Protein phosphatase 2C 3 [Striga hermonthica]